MPAGLEAGFARVCSGLLDLMVEWDSRVTGYYSNHRAPMSSKYRLLGCELVNLEGNAPRVCHLVLAQAGIVPSIGHFDTLGVDRWKFPGKRKG